MKLFLEKMIEKTYHLSVSRSGSYTFVFKSWKTSTQLSYDKYTDFWERMKEESRSSLGLDFQINKYWQWLHNEL